MSDSVVIDANHTRLPSDKVKVTTNHCHPGVFTVPGCGSPATDHPAAANYGVVVVLTRHCVRRRVVHE